MIDTKALLKIVDRHKKLVQDTRVYVRVVDKKLVVSSGNLSGVVLRTRTRADSADFKALVSVDALMGALRATKEAELSVADGRLVVKGKGMKADMPIEPGEPPSLPKTNDAAALPKKVVAALRDAVPRVDIPRLAKSGQLSIRCRDGELFAACTDDVHGAVYRGKGSGDLELGVFPQDSGLLTNALAHDDVAIAFIEGSLVINSKGDVEETVVIPTVACDYIPRDASSADVMGDTADSTSRRSVILMRATVFADESSRGM
jgi:hypothetical protein